LLAAIVEARRRFWSDSDRHRVERVNMLGAWTKITAQALEAIGAGDGSLAGAIAEDFAARRWQRMALFPGVTDALDRLRGRGVTLALVTNGDATHQRRKIQQYGLAGFFDAVLIEGEFGVGKPDPAVYRHVLTTLGADPAETWMVGDHL